MASESEPDERPRGILSPADRRWLRGETEYQHASTKSRRKSTVRERIKNGLLDFTLLFEELDDNLRGEVFEDADALSEARVAALAFWYVSGSDLSNEHVDRAFETALEEAIEAAFEKAAVGVGGVNATISIGRVQLLEKLFRALDETSDGDLADLPIAQLRRLHLTGWVGFDEYVKAVEKKRTA